MDGRTRLVSLDEAADRLGLNANTLRERSYRQRIGLTWVKVGQRVKFVEADLLKFIEERRQGASLR